MRILILGAGTVGSSVAESMCQLKHEVTLVDNNQDVLDQVDSELDVGVVHGPASQSTILFSSGVMSCDLCLALTGNDECNIVAASIAKSMGATRVAARVYADVFRDLSTFDYQNHFKIDRLLSLEHLAAMEFARRIREPGAMAIESFARGALEMQDVIISRPSSATGVLLKDLKLPPEVRIGSINRSGQVKIATANDKIEVGDRISLLGERSEVEQVKKMFNTQSFHGRSVAIAGGGEIGYHLALVLQHRGYHVTILDTDHERCTFLADHLESCTIIHCDARRRVLLEEEGIGEMDIFVACMGEDEDNIMACVEAQDVGVKNLMSVVERSDYANVVGKLGIKETVSPCKVVARQVEGLLNTGPLVFRNRYSLGGGIEVLEIEAQADSLITQNKLRDVSLPREGIIGAIIQEGYVQVPSADFRIRPGHTAVALVQSAYVEAFVQPFE